MSDKNWAVVALTAAGLVVAGAAITYQPAEPKPSFNERFIEAEGLDRVELRLASHPTDTREFHRHRADHLESIAAES